MSGVREHVGAIRWGDSSRTPQILPLLAEAFDVSIAQRGLALGAQALVVVAKPLVTASREGRDSGL
ncbi:hypothetical protein BRD09_07145 [Halobacteriales archaeon SW_10_68_16]|jgi:hypothetical protein|nr:MAG: hypothetical protein BRD09_07145 [Halobacteriales archaeon SW_10_68_16]